MRDLDSFESICYRICAYYFSGFDYFHFPAIYQAITAREVQDFLKTSVCRDRMSLAVIYPNKED